MGSFKNSKRSDNKRCTVMLQVVSTPIEKSKEKKYADVKMQRVKTLE